MLGQFIIVEHVAAAVLNSQFIGKILFGIYHRIGTVAQQEFFLDLGACLADDRFGAQILEQAGDLQTALEIAADTHKAHIKAVDR